MPRCPARSEAWVWGLALLLLSPGPHSGRAQLPSRTTSAPSDSEAAPATPAIGEPGRSASPTASEAAATDLRKLEREGRALEARLLTGAARRDTLLARLEAPLPHGFPARILASLRKRRDRASLEALVAALQRDQARLRDVRIERGALARSARERDWARLQALVDDAAAAWREGRVEEPMLGPAIAEALDRAGGEEAVYTIERFRSLVDRLARVNAVLLAQEPDSSGPGGGVRDRPTAGFSDSVHATGALPRPAKDDPLASLGLDPRASSGLDPHASSGLDPNSSGFLGVDERGLPLVRPDDASLEAWKRLRATLADEIVATATEITLRVRASS